MVIKKAKSSIAKHATSVDIDTLAHLLWEANNRFVRIVWESSQSKRFRKTNNPFELKYVTKRYVATVRNNYSFKHSVRRYCLSQGEPHPDFVPNERTWGGHIKHTPFVRHRNHDDNILRLHLHLLPTKYHSTEESGYYLNGDKMDGKSVKQLEKFKTDRKKPEGVLDTARLKKHPVNARMEDVLFMKISGNWYKLKSPSVKKMEALVNAVSEFSRKLESEIRQYQKLPFAS